jgi:hypothetical protein
MASSTRCRSRAPGPAALLAGLVFPGAAGAAEVNADVFFVPHDKIVIDDDDPGTREIRGGGDLGAGFRIESLPEQRHGWVLHAEYQAVEGSGLASDAEQTRLGIGGQLGRALFRVALYAEYARIDLDQGHIDGAGFQVRFNFRHLDPWFLNVQLGHQCLEGDLRFANNVDTQGFDLFELTANAGYRLSERWSILAEGRRRWEVISPDIVGFDATHARLGVRMSY